MQKRLECHITSHFYVQDFNSTVFEKPQFNAGMKL